MNKKLKGLANQVGSDLYDLSESVKELAFEIDHGPDLSDKEMEKLNMLFHVGDLLDVAFNIFPYEVKE